MLKTLQAPLEVYSSAWLHLLLERNNFLNNWSRFPLPQFKLSTLCPTHNINRKTCSSPVYSNFLFLWRLVMCPISHLFQKKQDPLIQPFPAFFLGVWSFSSLPFGSSGLSHPLWPIVLRTRHITPAKGLFALTRLFTSCSQHPAYTPQFHVSTLPRAWCF